MHRDLTSWCSLTQSWKEPLRKMEEDRAVADIGPDLSAELNGDDEAVKKTPKRRFIGRRAADAKAAARADSGGNDNIEGTGAVQGAGHFYITSGMRQRSDTSSQSHLDGGLPVP